MLVGSSLGGWLMLLAALARPGARLQALVGIAAAPDATEALMWQRFPPAQRADHPGDGRRRACPRTIAPDGYLITRALIEEGRRHLVMRATDRARLPRAAAPRHADPTCRGRPASRSPHRSPATTCR